MVGARRRPGNERAVGAGPRRWAGPPPPPPPISCMLPVLCAMLGHPGQAAATTAPPALLRSGCLAVPLCRLPHSAWRRRGKLGCPAWMRMDAHGCAWMTHNRLHPGHPPAPPQGARSRCEGGNGSAVACTAYGQCFGGPVFLACVPGLCSRPVFLAWHLDPSSSAAPPARPTRPRESRCASGPRHARLHRRSPPVPPFLVAKTTVPATRRPSASRPSEITSLRAPSLLDLGEGLRLAKTPKERGGGGA